MPGPVFSGTGTIEGPSINPFTPSIDALVPMANISDSTKLYKPVHGWYGTGSNFTLGLGYQINRYFEVGLGISYLAGSNIDCDQIRQLTGSGSALPGVIDAYYLNASISTHSSGLSIMPSVTISAEKKGWKVYPYARVGITLPVYGKVVHNVNINADTAYAHLGYLLNASPYFLGADTKVTLQTQAEVSVGINGSFGVAYRPIPLLSVYLEVNGQYLDVRAKSTQITQWSADGVSELSARGVYRTQFVYVDQLNNTSNNAQYNTSYNPNQPKQDVRPIAPFSNLGLNVGIKFYLGKKTLHKETKEDKEAKKGA